ncbi:twin-arginine translocation signal domain-containing protein [Dankookia rubra]|uniref:Twin-arginine translocation signal domain-containing protein n=1 Tax=Dankookia rubra TaxID=1442381 RepID=A0A4R5Q9Y5_9PROT|nr:twin-arginine translocation signal domain-containing protein [Dankookia rubra]
MDHGGWRSFVRAAGTVGAACGCSNPQPVTAPEAYSATPA